jgi:hypothetical protein
MAKKCDLYIFDDLDIYFMLVISLHLVENILGLSLYIFSPMLYIKQTFSVEL